MKKTIVFKGEDDLGLLNEIEQLRYKVWELEVNRETAVKRFSLDDIDNRSWHVVRYDNESIIASGRMTIANEKEQVPDLCSLGSYAENMRFPLGIMNRLVVDIDYRNQGIGIELFSKRIEKAQELNVKELWVEVIEKRIKGLQKLDFKVVGKSFDESIPGNWQILVKRFFE